ncbi:MAG: putative solute-binding protein [Moraxellaceae bacterium]
MSGKFKHLLAVMLTSLALPLAAQAADLTKVKVCVFDPAGQQGPAFSMARDQALEARKWGVDLQLQVFTDERIAAETFKVGQCDAVNMTSLRARQFVKFAGSVDAIGGIMTYQQMNDLIQLLASPKIGDLMTEGDYEVAGVIPLGAAYVMVNDRSINSVEKAAGKKVAVLDWDKSQAQLVQRMGAQPVASDISNFFGKFNNGQVDIIAAPAIAYKPLELYKGIGTKGAIYRFPVVNVTGAFVIRRSKMPKEHNVGQLARQYVAGKVDMAFDAIKVAEKDIPANQWMDLTASDKDRYTKMMREARLMLTADGTYDPRMMKILKRIRCTRDPSNYECTLKDE